MEISFPRKCLNSLGLNPRISRPPRKISPPSMETGSLMRRMSAYAVKDFPLPDSPTIPTFLPAGISKDTLSTTATRPFADGTEIERFLTTKEFIMLKISVNQARRESARHKH